MEYFHVIYRKTPKTLDHPINAGCITSSVLMEDSTLEIY